MGGPLEGVRVVDFSAVVSGPLATMWLADQGADVIKVETLEPGDITRMPSAYPELGGMAGLYVNCNRGKRCICVDVTTAEGRQVVHDLCREADVFVQNFRPGVVERLGLGYDDVAALRPDIIYVSISGFGPDGPYAQRRVYDPIIQGLTGHVAVQINPEIPFPDLVRTIVCDKASALMVAQAVSAALFARERGAGGQHIEVPMLDAGLAFFFPDGYMSKALLDDDKAELRPTLANTYRITPTADGHVIYYAPGPDQLHGVFRALGHPEWVEDERFSTHLAIFQNFATLGALMAEAFETWPTAELLPRMAGEDIAFAPMLNLDQVPEDPQILHNDMLAVRQHPVVGRILEARHPVRFSKTEVSKGPLAPSPGEHNDVILRELGRDEAAIAHLRETGVIA
jgi:crotonobetainyl-CoA:carnitine CoA-transferase CaiB-like acyl-CoA transferase